MLKKIKLQYFDFVQNFMQYTVFCMAKSAVQMIQIIILSTKTGVKKMSNLSSEDDFNNSEEESQELTPGRKYIKKSKTNKKNAHKIISSTYKKKRCQFYNKGACNKGSQCTFSHSFIPDVAKKICKFFLTNSCTKGQACPYSHNTKRYPCKFFHIQQHCGLGNQCRFSHQQIDPDFEDEFLKDNQEFLIKIYKQDKNLLEKYRAYVQNNDLLNNEKKKQNEPPKMLSNLPFIFGFQMIRTISREQNKNQPTISSIKKQISRKQSNNEQPFSIRLTHKNRAFLPEKLQAGLDHMQYQRQGEMRAQSDKDESSNEKDRQQELGSQKISRGIELTPESKSNRFYQGMQYYMCSYN